MAEGLLVPGYHGVWRPRRTGEWEVCICQKHDREGTELKETSAIMESNPLANAGCLQLQHP